MATTTSACGSRSNERWMLLADSIKYPYPAMVVQEPDTKMVRLFVTNR